MTETANPIRISKIGHIGLYCRDLQKMLDFYVRILGFQLSDVNERGMHFLRFGADHHSFVLVVMPEQEKQKSPGPQLVAQIALEVDCLDTLKRIRRYLVGQGVNVRGKIKHEGPGGNYVLDFDDPERNPLQFFSDMDQIGADGRSRPKEQWQRFHVDD